MPTCPQCHLWIVREAGRRGVWEHLLRGVCIHPFRCQLCDCRFLASRPGPSSTVRRDYERILVKYPARLSTREPNARTTDGTVLNLSIKGCLLSSSSPLTRGEQFQLSFTPDDDPSTGVITITRALVRGAVGSDYGIEFLNTDSDNAFRLRQLIRNRLSPMVIRPT